MYRRDAALKIQEQNSDVGFGGNGINIIGVGNMVKPRRKQRDRQQEAIRKTCPYQIRGRGYPSLSGSEKLGGEWNLGRGRDSSQGIGATR